jgi:hypothetical protein
MLDVGKLYGPSSPVGHSITFISITPDAPNPLTSNSIYPVFPSSRPTLIPILTIVNRWTPPVEEKIQAERSTYGEGCGVLPPVLPFELSVLPPRDFEQIVHNQKQRLR